MSKLTVYRASAGSGKTYKITEEYLRLLFKYPYNYRHILAVTFTNKATAEMKNRIIHELYKLAQHTNSDYLNTFSKEFNLSGQQISDKAEKILNYILHDFSRLSIGTIDSFFQRIISWFTREIGVQFGFNIELDTIKILKVVINKLWHDIDNNDILKKWLIQFVESKIEQGANWNFNNDVLKLGKEIFTELYQQFSMVLINKLSNKDFLEKYVSNLHHIIYGFENTLKGIGKKGLELIENHSLEIEDFAYGKSGVANYFKKIRDKNEYEPGKRVVLALNVPENWHTKNSSYKEEIIEAYHSGLNAFLNEAIEYYNKKSINYNTAKQILKTIYTLGLLTDISSKIRQYTHDENLFLLANAGKLLYEIIDENPVPFVYEKAGSYLRHFMIDEFQDTSEIQWKNFIPLITDSLSENNMSILVGDIKQAIYRWRNSNWQILASGLQNEFQHFGINNNILEYNWRSKRNIILFNNILFSAGSYILQQEFNSILNNNADISSSYGSVIHDAYKDIVQKTPSKAEEGGMVYFNFIKNDEIGWKEKVISNLPAVIKRLVDSGLLLKDIAILVRRKEEGKLIADRLLQTDNFKIEIISDESLYISSSLPVQVVISILKYICNPIDNINISFLLNTLNSYINKNDNHDFDFRLIIEKYEIFKDITSLKNLSLYELVEEIVKRFNLWEIDGQKSYISAFQDLVYEYTLKNSSDINKFMEWWNEEGVRKCLPANEQVDAIRILTIHKSKGLEFKGVIIPFCDWGFDHHSSLRNTIWCKPGIEPFNHIDLVPIEYSSKLSNTIFINDYYEEKLKSYIDNLNLLYVAFTRAKETLIAYGPDNSRSELKNTSDLIKKVISSENSLNFENISQSDYDTFLGSYNNEKNRFIFGQLPKTVQNDSNNTIERINASKPLKSYQRKLWLKLNGSDYFNDNYPEKMEKINYGNIMHELFEKINSIEDVDRAITELEILGKIEKRDGEKIRSKILVSMEDKKIKDWFTENWDYKKEASILLNDGSVLRPDKVLVKNDKAIVIDYKFGEIRLRDHQDQVEKYMSCLRIMGYNEICGYLWYFDMQEIHQVGKS